MCLPLRLLKCIVGFEAWVTLLLGFGALITGIVVSVRMSDATQFFQGIEENSGKGVIITTYILGGILVLFGITGIVGGSKKSACLLALFNIGNCASLLVFLIIGSVAYIFAAAFSEATQTQCLKQEWSLQLQNMTALAEGTFCQKNQCECYIEDVNDFNQTSLNNASITFYSNDSALGGVTQFQECSQYKNATQDDKDLINAESTSNFLKFIEQSFDCAGWCSPYPIYLFSDINRGPPSNGDCYTQTSLWLQTNGNIIGDISMIVAGLLLLSIMFTCCLCYHPEKKMQTGNFYQRMAYYDE